MMSKKLKEALDWARNDKLSAFSIEQISIIATLRITVEDLIAGSPLSCSRESIAAAYNSKFENNHIKVLKKHFKKMIYRIDRAYYLFPTID